MAKLQQCNDEDDTTMATMKLQQCNKGIAMM